MDTADKRVYNTLYYILKNFMLFMEVRYAGVILAAGMGRRLKELTSDNTKCMVKVNGVTLNRPCFAPA